MKRKLVLGLAIAAIVPLLACQRIENAEQVVAKRMGLAPAATQTVTSANAASVLPAASNGYRTGVLETRTMQVDGLQRKYHVYVPRSLASGQLAPTIFAFHGGGGNAQQFASRMGFTQMAERYGAIVVLPQAYGRGGKDSGVWNAASTTPQGFAEKQGVNDIGFLQAMMSTLQASYPMDRSRVYAAGFSNGGMFAYHAACELGAQKISAVAAVASTLSAARCSYPKGISVLHIHGTNDENVPFEGGRGDLTGRSANWPAVSRGLQIFETGNQCSISASTVRPSSDTVCTINACGGNDEVELCMVQGGGHAWPGGDPANWQVKNNVYVSQQFDATSYIAQFLLEH